MSPEIFTVFFYFTLSSNTFFKCGANSLIVYFVSRCAAGEKAIVCDQCGAQFQTEESLEAHRQIHTGKQSAVTHSTTN